MPVNLQRYQAVDVLANLLGGFSQAWFCIEDDELLAILVTKIDNFARRRGFNLWCVGGEPHRMQEWFVEADKVLTDHAIKMGCDHFEITGRKGWERVLGFSPRAVFYVKDLQPELNRSLEGAPIEEVAPMQPKKNKNNGSSHHVDIEAKIGGLVH